MCCLGGRGAGECFVKFLGQSFSLPTWSLVCAIDAFYRTRSVVEIDSFP